MLGFPPHEIPHAYPFDHDAYGDTPLGEEVESMRAYYCTILKYIGFWTV